MTAPIDDLERQVHPAALPVPCVSPYRSTGTPPPRHYNDGASRTHPRELGGRYAGRSARGRGSRPQRRWLGHRARRRARPGRPRRQAVGAAPGAGRRARQPGASTRRTCPASACRTASCPPTTSARRSPGARPSWWSRSRRRLRELAHRLSPLLPDDALVVHGTKGLERESLLRLSEVVERELRPTHHGRVAVLSGPTHAEEVGRGIPAAAVVAEPRRRVGGGAPGDPDRPDLSGLHQRRRRRGRAVRRPEERGRPGDGHRRRPRRRRQRPRGPDHPQPGRDRPARRRGGRPGRDGGRTGRRGRPRRHLHQPAQPEPARWRADRTGRAARSRPGRVAPGRRRRPGHHGPPWHSPGGTA